MDYPKYNFDKVPKIRSLSKINCIIILIAVGMKYLFGWNFNVYAVIVCVIVVRHVLKFRRFHFGIIGAKIFLAYVFLIGCDWLDHKINWSISIMGQVFMLMAMVITLSLILLYLREGKKCLDKIMSFIHV